MTQEEKQLLLKDLCARLPYELKVGFSYDLGSVYILKGEEIDYFVYGELDIKPYLRPMSSMTEEEIRKYHSYCECNDCDFNGEVLYFNTIESIDYLNSIHVDYRGLIPKGLAIEVTKENNPYEN